MKACFTPLAHSDTRKSRTFWTTAALMLWLSAFSGLASATIYVNGEVPASGDGRSWAQAKRTIGEGVTAAAWGEEVWVARGVYREYVGMRGGVHVYGGFSGTGLESSLEERNVTANTTLIMAPAASRAVRFYNTSNTRLDGFMIGGGFEYSGGGILFENAGATNRLANCRIAGNVARYGGAIFCTGSSPVIMNCVIAGNWAQSSGGAIRCEGSAPWLLNCTISSNLTSSAAGAIHLNTGSSASIVSCILSTNSGYSIYEADAASDPYVANCLFFSSGAGAYFDFGGRSYNDSEVAQLAADLPSVNSLFSGNPEFLHGRQGTWDGSNGVVYDSATSTTLLTDSGTDFSTLGRLTGVLINPNIVQKRQFIIRSVNANTIRVQGDLTDVVSSGDPYQLLNHALYDVSPAIDGGYAVSGAPNTDLAGGVRPVDIRGVRDGEGFLYDIGAFEYFAAAAFDAAPTTVEESGGGVTLPVTVAPLAGVTNPTINYTVYGGTASGSGIDFTLQGSGTLSFSAADPTAEIAIDIVDDTAVEDDETIVIHLTSPYLLALGAGTSHTLTILDDDVPTIEFAAAESSAMENAGVVDLPLALSAPVGSRGGSINYAIGAGGTAGDTDYTLLGTGTLAIPAGAQTAAIQIEINNDADIEPNETVVVQIADPNNLMLGTVLLHTFTIVDDDTPTVRFTAASTSTNENSDPFQIEVIVSPPPGPAGASVEYFVSGGTATGGGVDYTLVDPGTTPTMTLTFAEGETQAFITVAPVLDDVPEQPETVIIGLRNAVNVNLGTPIEHTVTIYDYDTMVSERFTPWYGQGNGNFGFAVAGAYDVTGDGGGDVVVGAFGENVGGKASAGRVYIIDATSGTLVRTQTSPDATVDGSFGRAVAVTVAADSLQYCIVGAPGEAASSDPLEAGRAHVYSVATGARTATISSPSAEESGRFGTAVAAVGGAFVVGAPTESVGLDVNAGRAYVVGANGDVYNSLVSPNAKREGLFGFAVSSVPSIDGDAVPDVVVGAPGENRVYIFSGASGSRIRTISGAANTLFGIAVGGMADIDGDGAGEVIVGAQGATASNGAIYGGAVYVYSMLYASPVRSFESPDPVPFGFFGNVVRGLTDTNDDGVADIFVGTQYETPPGNPEYAGRGFVFDGATGALLRSLASGAPQLLGSFGCAAAPVPDVDGDGFHDLIVGAYSEASPGQLARTGAAYLFSIDLSDVIVNPPDKEPAGAANWVIYR